MIIPRLALRNLLGAGLRTWLNVVVLSFSFVIIIWLQGLYKGMGDQARVAQTNAEFGGGQYWQEMYDLSLSKMPIPLFLNLCKQ